MNLNNVFICDIETKGFLDDIKTFEDLHVFGVAYKGGFESRTDY